MTATLVVLDRAECLDLLRGQPVGRIAVIDGDSPLVVPVNYTLDGDCVVFRSEGGTKLDALARHEKVSFEVDAIDWYHRTGWSVLVRGTAYEATHWEVDHLLLEPWTEGDKRHWVRIPITEITGRRLEAIEADWPLGGHGYL